MIKLTVEYIRNGNKVAVHIVVDNTAFTDETYNFIDTEHAEGMLADEFHNATGNRYKPPTTAIHQVHKLKVMHE